MANGQPTSLRMGFGGKDALRSGIRGFRVKSTAQLNATVGWEREQVQIREIVTRHPELGDLVRQMVAAQTALGELCTSHILEALHGRLAQKSKK
jgi:hypothetical protein